MDSREIITIKDLTFAPYISTAEIASVVGDLAKRIDKHYAGKLLTVIVVLKGAYIFAADLLRMTNVNSEIFFIQLSSYQGTRSTGRVDIALGNLPNLDGKHVLIVEDIIDSGLSMQALLRKEIFEHAASTSLCTLLLKPDNLEVELEIQFIGKIIPPAFVVGYGLDYDELGRDLPAIYQLAE